MANSAEPSLLCPSCLSELSSGARCAACGHVVDVRDGVYCYVSSGYSRSFGAQWTEFARTQLDSANGTSISELRFREVTGWCPTDLANRTVLDVGCGSGRFTEAALRWGAHVTAVDLSEAVFAARTNVKGAERARFVQANATDLPLPKRSFDFAFSIGVVQHTPDPLRFVQSVAEAVRPGGEAAFWMYERTLSALLHPKYVFRPLTRRMPIRFNRVLTTVLVNAFFPMAELLQLAPQHVRPVAVRALPIACYLGQLPLSRDQQKQWSLLDTLDWYSPCYDSPQRFDDVARVLQRAGAKKVERRGVGGLAIRAAF